MRLLSFEIVTDQEEMIPEGKEYYTDLYSL
jgi:hypothetical protein